MKSVQQLISVLIVAVLLLSIFSGCGVRDIKGETPQDVTEQTTQTAQAEVTKISSDDMFSDRDIDFSYDESTAVSIELKGNSASASGNSVKINGSVVTVSQEGTYILSGSLADGQIVIDAQNTDKIQLVLKGVDITSSTASAIYVKQAEKVFITLAENTDNTISDSSEYTSVDENNPDGAIFGQDDITINGSGKLTVTGNYKHGIVSQDDLTVTSGNINIASVKDALRGKDSVRIGGGQITVKAQSDGIMSTNTEESDKGFVYVADGNIDITSANDGIQAENYTHIKGGNIKITSGGGSQNGETHTEDMPMRGGFGNQYSQEDTTDTDSIKGIKAANDITIEGGTITIDSADDSLHSNGVLTINGGDISLSSGDDGMHADSALLITDGNLNISKSYEGIEGKNITIKGGNISVVASDDGMNSAGGNDGSSVNGRGGENPFDVDAEAFIEISGGYILLDASGDGVDSNGTLNVSGGTLLVNGPTNGGNGAIDSGSTPTISGGTVIAIGSAGMSQGFGGESTQCSLTCNISGLADRAISLADSSGNIIISYIPTKQYGNVVISSPTMTQGETYGIYIGGTASDADENGFATSGNLNGGEKASDITLSDISNGSGYGNQGGFNGGGQMQPGGPMRPDRPM